MILLVYIVLILMACSFTLLNTRQPIYYVVVLFSLVFWSYISRTFALQQDMLVYSEVMGYDWDFYKGFYTLREPIYWFTSKILFDIINNNQYVFMLMDSIFFSLLVYFSFKNNIKPYFILLFILFFPNLMGFLNVYRQFLCTLLLFISFLLVTDNPFKSKLMYLVSGLTHNVAIVFLPLIFLKKKFIQLNFFFFSFISIVLTLLFSGSKSEVETGETSPILFLAVIFILSTIFLALNKLVLYKKNIDLYYLNFYCIIVSIVSCVFLANAPAKRICMMTLVFLLYSIYWFIENNRKNIVAFRLILIIFTVIPTFMFPSALNMLLMESN